MRLMIDLCKAGPEKGLIRWSDEPTVFASGAKSRVVVSGREDLTENPSLLLRVGEEIAGAVMRLQINTPGPGRQPCLIGIPAAGTPLAAAASLWAIRYRPNWNLCFRQMRQKHKDHGRPEHRRWVDGKPDQIAHQYFTVDNTITDGGSKLETIERLKEDKYPVGGMAHIILVDRQEGGVERLRKQGIKVVPIFSLSDIICLLEQEEIWPKKIIAQIRGELASGSPAV